MTRSQSLSIVALCVFVMAMCVLALAGAASTRAAGGDGAAWLFVWENAQLNGQRLKVSAATPERSISDLRDISFGGLLCNNGSDVGGRDWDNCISSLQANFDDFGCVQVFAGYSYAGDLIYSKTVRPGDSLGSFTLSSLGADNDRASSIRIGPWTGTRNAGHCAWLP